MKKIAIVHAAHDGVMSMYTGIGRILQDIILSFEKIKSIVPDNCKLSLYLITINFPTSCSAYNDSLYNKNKQIVKSNKGKIIRIFPPKDRLTANQIWGETNWWKRVGIKTSKIIDDLSSKYDLVVFFHHDIVFASSNLDLKNKLNNITSIWVHHSTSQKHGYSLGDKERLKLEKKVVDHINNTSFCYAAAIGGFMHNHLKDCFKINNNKIIKLKNGIIQNDTIYPALNIKESTKILKKYNIPLDVPIVFFWGRCTAFKGVDLLIKSLKRVKENFHFVFVAPTETSNDRFLNDVKKNLIDLGSKATSIFDFKKELPFAVLSHKNTSVVVLPSRCDPCPLTVMEAKYYQKNNNYTIITSYVDGLMEQYVPGGTVITTLTIKNLADKISYCLKLSPGKKKTMARKSYNSLKDWNFTYNHLRGMKKILDKQIK